MMASQVIQVEGSLSSEVKIQPDEAHVCRQAPSF